MRGVFYRVFQEIITMNELFKRLYKMRILLTVLIFAIDIGLILYGIAVYEIGGADIFLALVLMIFPFLFGRIFGMSDKLYARKFPSRKCYEKGTAEYDRVLAGLIGAFTAVSVLFIIRFFTTGYAFVVYFFPSIILGMIYAQRWRMTR